MVEAPGTAPGSAWLITTSIYRHSRIAPAIGYIAGAGRRAKTASLDEMHERLAAMSSPLPWTITVTDIPARGLALRSQASAAERAAVQAALDVRAVQRLEATGHIERLAAGRYRLRGTVHADIVQACVITTDDVPGHVEAPLAVEFRPDALVEDTDIDFEADEDIEPILRGTTLETGRVVFEVLAAHLDPYPRAANAETGSLTTEPRDGSAGPFAALGKLKKG
jgi:hypothetical protein